MKDRVEHRPGGNLEMDVEEMRRLGHAVVDLVIDRWAHLAQGPSWSGGSRADLEAKLAAAPPEFPEDPAVVLEEAVQKVLSRAGRIDHPRFFAFIPSSPTWPSVLGDFLATGFNIFQGTWLESAGPSQLELVVLDWFRQWLGFPESGGGILTSGGSAANLVAMVACREQAENPSRGVVYMSDQGHISLVRAARVAGISQDRLRKIPTDGSFRMDLSALRRTMEEDLRRGMAPLCICANGGATNTGAVDPLTELSVMASEVGAWFHVDAAYGGFAVLTPEGSRLFAGIDRADSVTLDPHKWFFQPYETGCLMVRDVRRLEKAFKILPEYLQDAELGEEQVNFADRGLQLTRGFRALKIWMSVRMLGLDAFRNAIGASMELATRAEAFIRASPVLEMTGPPSLGIVCFRFRPREARLDPASTEALNSTIQRRIVESGTAMMSSTRLKGVFSLRMAIMNYRSRWEHIQQTLEDIERIGAQVYGAGGFG